ncbi:hypothetical protein Aple_067930 [Acrocarpospora pleiomorpha]|uniref:Amidohydrolase-related domain-containing protein n=1 Tax=Acrocarpospora pleiomorpha TaxID=90975 RepID=A0A5M3XRN2_9ACTN|nr:DUF6282 family protein [Acrocarpospora pleiomorpha]GES23894.1 hypothetical protein Aple_067930 [Acrocarpospora pleiomorpha]
MSTTLPDWAVGMTDLHVHAAPSLLPRHAGDRETVRLGRSLGFVALVLKSHEGSTVERAMTAGDGAIGGIVLNSAVGGANADAAEVAARLGGRIVWMPTVSSATHKRGSANTELRVHSGFSLRLVDVIVDGRILPAWLDVLDVIAHYNMVLASGHLSADETVQLFTEARRRGVERLLVNHPKMVFLGWHEDASKKLRKLDARLELGILPDLLGSPEHTSLRLLEEYPHELLIFGGDLGHAHHPDMSEALPPWLAELEARAGASAARAIMTSQGRELILP